MKKTIAIILVLVMCVSLCSCKSKDVKNVETLIDAIGEVTVNSEQAITDAEEAYASLDDDEKADVENYELLTSARADFDALFVSIEITIDNWQDYFELVTAVSWEENDFDEITGAFVNTCFCIKEEFSDRVILNRSELILETCNYWTLAAVDFDLGQKTIGEIQYFEPKSEGILIGERTTYRTYNLMDAGYYSSSDLLTNRIENILFEFSNGYVPDSMYDGVDNQKGYSFVDYSISRIKGTIVVIKES